MIRGENMNIKVTGNRGGSPTLPTDGAAAKTGAGSGPQVKVMREKPELTSRQASLAQRAAALKPNLPGRTVGDTQKAVADLGNARGDAATFKNRSNASEP